MNIYVELLGYMAGLTLALFTLPQAISSIKTKNVSGISFASYLLYSISMVLWATYGYFLASKPMMIFNLVSLFFAMPVLYLIIKTKIK